MSNRIVKSPSVESSGHLTPDKWLLLKTLEESAEMVEAGKQYLKASDPTDPSGIGREFDDHANRLACFGVNMGGELGDDRDRAKTGWIGYVRDQRRQAMLDEPADVFTDGGFLRRKEYDGSEWWEYEPPFRGPETQKPFGRVKRTYPAYSLEDINYPMEATEE